jgi:hypothetical protein
MFLAPDRLPITEPRYAGLSIRLHRIGIRFLSYLDLNALHMDWGLHAMRAESRDLRLGITPLTTRLYTTRDGYIIEALTLFQVGENKPILSGMIMAESAVQVENEMRQPANLISRGRPSSGRLSRDDDAAQADPAPRD